MRPAVNVANVVRKHKHVLRIAGVVLQCYLATQHLGGVLFGNINDVPVKNFLALVEVFDEHPQPVVEPEHVLLAVALVFERYLQARIQVRHFSDSLDERIVLKLSVAEHLLVRHKSYLRTALCRIADLLNAALRDSPDTLEMIMLSVAIDVRLEPLAQGVDHADADPVQPAGHFIAVLVELATRVQRTEHDLEGAFLRLLVLLDGYSTPVILDHTASVGVNLNRHLVAVAGHRLINRVIQDLVNKMVQPAYAAVADVHIRPFANGLEPTQYLYSARIVLMLFHTIPLEWCGRRRLHRLCPALTIDHEPYAIWLQPAAVSPQGLQQLCTTQLQLVHISRRINRDGQQSARVVCKPCVLCNRRGH